MLSPSYPLDKLTVVRYYSPMRRSVHPVRAALRAVEGAGDSANTTGVFAMDHCRESLLATYLEALNRIPNHQIAIVKGLHRSSQFLEPGVYTPGGVGDVVCEGVEPLGQVE